MSDWRRINQRIAAARATQDPVAALRRLFEEENDGHVAMALGRQFRGDGNLTQAAHWFERAETLYPLQRFKSEARQARAAVTGGPGTNEVGVPARSASDTLHIISCSRHKAWDDPRVVTAYLPAQEAYRGAEITAWRERSESRIERWLILSAKYGFIEPDHPIAPYDVTFNDSATGPISDATLRAQVEHQVRWADRLPLKAFRRVVVHGSSAYVAKVKRAFAATGAEIATPDAGRGIRGETASESMTGAIVLGRARDIGAALGALPGAVYERLDCGEPEWPVIKALAAQPHPWGVMCALALGLCDYQLGAGGAEAYWAAIGQLLGRRSVKSNDDIVGFVKELVTQQVSKRLATQKLDRVRRLASSDLSDGCGRMPLDELGRHGEKLWSRLATAMQQSPDAKTIVFAMKCFDLLHKAQEGRYASFGDIPIIVDLRIARLSLTSGLLVVPGASMARALQEASTVATANHGALIEAWNAVRAAAGGLSLLRIDSLVWQLARPIHDHHTNPTQATSEASALLQRAGAESQVAAFVSRELTAGL